MQEDLTRSQLSPRRHIPTALTVFRIVIAAVFPFAPESFHLILIAIGLLTEFLDGYIARLYHWTSYLGQVLDPIADKLFVLSVSLTWIWLGKLSAAQWLLLGLRDFGVLFIFLTLVLLGRLHSTKAEQARLPSKLTTVLQYLVFFLVLFGNLAYLTPLATLTAVVGLAATGQYAYLLRKSLRSAEQA